MVTKINKPSSRIKTNTDLLVIATIVFGVITFCGVNRLQAYRKNLTGVSDAPALCYDEETYKKSNGSVRQDTYLYSSDGTTVTDQKDYTMFLYDRVSLTTSSLSYENGVLLTAIGGMLTIASLVAAIVYWNHNRQ